MTFTFTFIQPVYKMQLLMSNNQIRITFNWTFFSFLSFNFRFLFLLSQTEPSLDQIFSNNVLKYFLLLFVIVLVWLSFFLLSFFWWILSSMLFFSEISLSISLNYELSNYCRNILWTFSQKIQYSFWYKHVYYDNMIFLSFRLLTRVFIYRN